jgi:hypothetical protein
MVGFHKEGVDKEGVGAKSLEINLIRHSKDWDTHLKQQLFGYVPEAQ